MRGEIASKKKVEAGAKSGQRSRPIAHFPLMAA
jgi:hypothetical protein